LLHDFAALANLDLHLEHACDLWRRRDEVGDSQVGILEEGLLDHFDPFGLDDCDGGRGLLVRDSEEQRNDRPVSHKFKS
jgi:hypothetical protein